MSSFINDTQNPTHDRRDINQFMHDYYTQSIARANTKNSEIIAAAIPDKIDAYIAVNGRVTIYDPQTKNLVTIQPAAVEEFFEGRNEYKGILTPPPVESHPDFKEKDRYGNTWYYNPNTRARGFKRNPLAKLTAKAGANKWVLFAAGSVAAPMIYKYIKTKRKKK